MRWITPDESAGEAKAVMRERTRRLALVAIATSVAYYVGAQIGLGLTPSSQAISTFWPPNAILLGVLLLAPFEWWLPLLLATFPAHILVELQGGVPLGLVLSWFVSNCTEALIGAACIRFLIPRPVHFDTVGRVSIFVGFGVLLAPFLSSFLDVAFAQWSGWHTDGPDYWSLWRSRFFSDALAILTLVPIIKRMHADTLKGLRSMGRRRLAEAALLGAGLLVVCIVALRQPAIPLTQHVLLFVPLPFLLWAAVRFGPGGASACLLAFSVFSVWAVVHGEGPFSGSPEADDILSVQLYLIVTYIPIVVLSAVISERAHAESLARRDEERLNLVLGAAQMGTWDLDISTGRTTLCGRSREIFGLTGSPCEIGWSTFTASLGDNERARVEAATARAIEHDEPYEVEVQVEQPGSGTRWVLSKGSVVRDPHGRPLRMLGIHVDVTERKQAEAALREEATHRALREELEQRVAERTAELSLINRVLLEEIDVRERIGRALRASEERFAKAFRASPDAMSIIRRADARIIEVNERWVGLFGFSREEAIGQTLQALGISQRDANRDGLGLLSSPQGSVRDAEVELHNRRGEALYVLVTSETVEVAGEQCLIAMIRDITERRRAEHEVVAQRRQLAHLGRVALLGELSGALAHELNQPLAAILANARAAQRMLFRDELDRVELSRILEDIAADDRRAGSVIHRVRAMLRQGETEPQRVVANDLIAEVLDLAHSDLIQRSVTVTTRLDPSLPSVAADRVQLQQVLLNLIVNACDAMTDNAPTDRHIWIATGNEGAAVRVSVSDCGAGISRHPVDSVFEPFITSKAHGLGLGLSICRSIVDGHGGRMWASNNEDRGATFTFLLPRTEVALEVPPVWRAPELTGTAR